MFLRSQAKEAPLHQATGSDFACLASLGKKEVSVEKDQGWSLSLASLQMRRGTSTVAEERKLLVRRPPRPGEYGGRRPSTERD